MQSLILEGGTFRPIFSTGVMDCLLEHGIEFPYVIGVSAGITNGVSYVSKQKLRNLNVLMKYRHDKRYMGIANLWKNQCLFGMDFIYEEIPAVHFPFDWDTYQAFKGRVLIGATNAATGKPEYFDGLKLDKKSTMLRATCAIPLVFPAIEIAGEKYYDGGLADPIPIRKAITDGNEKHLIILTRCKGYEKTDSKQNKFAVRMLRRKYPNLVEVFQNRHLRYNETVKFCEQLEKEGKAIIIRPSEPIESFEKDLVKLKAGYDMGYRMAEEQIEAIKALFQ